MKFGLRFLLLCGVGLGLVSGDGLRGQDAGGQPEIPQATVVRVLPGSLVGGSTPPTMVRDSLHREAAGHFDRWRQDYEARTEPRAISEYQAGLRAEFIGRIGGLPGPAPLRPQVTGTAQRQGYTVEKVLFESEPQFYVTAGLFLPDPAKFPPPWPAVVILCGHAAEGKLQEGYQTGSALAALNGLAAMIVDPVGQGERMQELGADGKPTIPGPTNEHTVLGTSAILVGWNTARWMIGDAMAAIDYLQTRPDIRDDRIGCMGNSGGGTQTCYLMALDERITAAAPSCYVTSFRRLLETIGPQDAEQNIFGQIALGMDHADYLMMRAPKPTLINCATRDFFDIGGTWGAFRDAKRLFQRLDAGRNIELVEVDATHGWHPMLRRASVQFMVEHLAGRIGDFVEPEIVPLTAQEMTVTPEGQVLKLAGAVSAFDQVRQEASRLAAERAEARPSPETLRQTVRQVAGIRDLADLAEPVIERFEPLSIGELTYERLALRVGEDIWLPALLARPPVAAGQQDPKPTDKRVTLLMMGEGKAEVVGRGGEVERRVAAGETVLAIDLRGVGETKPDGQRWYHQRFGANGGNAVLAYLLGKSLVGIRAEDCLVVGRWLGRAEGVARVNAVASDELNTSVLHAAALEPELFGAVELRGGLVPWADVVAAPGRENQVVGLVHAGLAAYDLPDLTDLIRDRLTIRDR
jgi:dienelactone hydrolase